MAIYHCSVKHGSKGGGASGTAKSDYVCRQGKYADKEDLVYRESGNMPEWAKKTPRTFWKASDQNERENGRVWTEIELSLPREISAVERQFLVRSFVKDQLQGHPYTLAIHNPKALDGEEQPHAHIIFSERKLDGIDRDKGQFFKRANKKEPAKGGTAKDRAWNDRGKVQQIREAWEAKFNIFSPEPVSCKSLKAQGIDREPEPKLGPKGLHSPAADRIKEVRADRLKLDEVTREINRLTKEIEVETIKAEFDQVQKVSSPVTTIGSGQSAASPPEQKTNLPSKPAFVPLPPVIESPRPAPAPDRPADWYLKCLELIRELVYKWRTAVRNEDERDEKLLVTAIKAELAKTSHKKIHFDESGPIFLDDTKAIVILIGDEKKRLGLTPQQTKGKKI